MNTNSWSPLWYWSFERKRTSHMYCWSTDNCTNCIPISYISWRIYDTTSIFNQHINITENVRLDIYNEKRFLLFIRSLKLIWKLLLNWRSKWNCYYRCIYWIIQVWKYIHSRFSETIVNKKWLNCDSTEFTMKYSTCLMGEMLYYWSSPITRKPVEIRSLTVMISIRVIDCKWFERSIHLYLGMGKFAE